MTYMTLVYQFRCLYLMDRCNIPYHIKKNELERTAHPEEYTLEINNLALGSLVVKEINCAAFHIPSH